MNNFIEINGRRIGPNEPTYIIAELSANHGHDFEVAVKLVEAAKAAGADAIKLQTYTPDTLTIDSNQPYFQIKGTIWEGYNLYKLYDEAYMPWEWQPKLKQIANELGLDLFSTPFDDTAVDFLQEMNVPAFKIASFENVDLPLIRRVAQTGKPLILSNGMATLAELDEAVQTVREAGGEQLALLKCVSSYPAVPAQMHLRTIPHLAAAFGVPVGLSDHSMDVAVPVAAVTLGACIIEKHFTLSREMKGPDSTFSLEPDEFATMVAAVRTAEQALGGVQYGPTAAEKSSQTFRRSLFVVADMAEGELFTEQNVRSIRPGHGLHTRYLSDVLGRKANRPIERGTPLTWDLI
ncbi:MAG: pseudaminic acid synthase [Chloroflexi bacterium]|nr:pseudaminic acid synthase [Chloroflexota bacterium]